VCAGLASVEGDARGRAVNLREQILDIARRRVNEEYARAASFPRLVDSLAAKAFGERWDVSVQAIYNKVQNGRFITDEDAQFMLDVKALHRAWDLLNGSKSAVSDNEPAVTLVG
jgi:hypothetical protein